MLNVECHVEFLALFMLMNIIQGGAEETHVFQMASTRQGCEPADSSDYAHWNAEQPVFAVEQFLSFSFFFFLKQLFRSYCPNVFSIESSMLSVEVQFQIETLYSDGMKHLQLLDLS